MRLVARRTPGAATEDGVPDPILHDDPTGRDRFRHVHDPHHGRDATLLARHGRRAERAPKLRRPDRTPRGDGTRSGMGPADGASRRVYPWPGGGFADVAWRGSVSRSEPLSAGAEVRWTGTLLQSRAVRPESRLDSSAGGGGALFCSGVD